MTVLCVPHSSAGGGIRGQHRGRVRVSSGGGPIRSGGGPVHEYSGGPTEAARAAQWERAAWEGKLRILVYFVIYDSG